MGGDSSYSCEKSDRVQITQYLELDLLCFSLGRRGKEKKWDRVYRGDLGGKGKIKPLCCALLCYAMLYRTFDPLRRKT